MCANWPHNILPSTQNGPALGRFHGRFRTQNSINFDDNILPAQLSVLARFQMIHTDDLRENQYRKFHKCQLRHHKTVKKLNLN